MLAPPVGLDQPLAPECFTPTGQRHRAVALAQTLKLFETSDSFEPESHLAP